MDQSNKTNSEYERVLVGIAKNEGPYLLDWISYHKAIGFTHIVILNIEAGDGSVKLLRKINKKDGSIRYVDNVDAEIFDRARQHEAEMALIAEQKNTAAPNNFQRQTRYFELQEKAATKRERYMSMLYSALAEEPAVANADWLMFLDIDEFLRVDVGSGTLDDLYKVLNPQIGAISFMPQIFGANGQTGIQREGQLFDEFTSTSAPLQIWPPSLRAMRTLYRADAFARFGQYRPKKIKGRYKDSLIWIDADGVPQQEYLRDDALEHARENGFGFGTALGRINHYPLRSRQAAILKHFRGSLKNDPASMRSALLASEHWRMNNWLNTPQTRILNLKDARDKFLERFMANKNIRRHHQTAVSYHLRSARKIISETPLLLDDLDSIPPSSAIDLRIRRGENKNRDAIELHPAKLQQKLPYTLLPPETTRPLYSAEMRRARRDEINRKTRERVEKEKNAVKKREKARDAERMARQEARNLAKEQKKREMRKLNKAAGTIKSK